MPENGTASRMMEVFGHRTGIGVEQQKDGKERHRQHRDEPLPHALDGLVLAAPDELVAGGDVDFARPPRAARRPHSCPGRVRPHRRRHIRSAGRSRRGSCRDRCAGRASPARRAAPARRLSVAPVSAPARAPAIAGRCGIRAGSARSPRSARGLRRWWSRSGRRRRSSARTGHRRW